MRPARSRRAGQHGLVAVVLIALLVLGGALFTFSSFNVASVGVNRERASNDALAKAKDALIAYAVVDPVRPGQLPCPDVNNDGEAKSGEDFNAATGACNSLIGRLPWITLGLPDLRDDSGEGLWYAVSGDFRAGNTAVPLNSDTAYRGGNASLTLAGTTPASNLVAIVFAPGQTLQRSDGASQARGCTVGTNCDANLKCTTSPASATPKCNPVNFLDVTSGVDNADANQSFVAAPESANFNDKLAPIFSDDIMRLVERRAARELAQHLRNHYDMWEGAPVANTKGFYPYAASFNDPSTAQVGTNGTTAGLLPLASTPLTWSNFSSACSTESGGTVLHCQAVCAIILFIHACLPGEPSGQVANVATRFVDPPGPANIQWVLLNIGGNANWTLNPAQRRLDFNYSALLAVGNIDFRVTAPAVSSWVGTSWLTANNWHQNAGYTLSSGYAINGVDSCGGAAPPCVTVSNTTGTTNNKHAVVVMTGRALPSASPAQTTRPIAAPAPLDQFLEGANAIADLVFEQNARTDAFNDTPAAVRP